MADVLIRKLPQKTLKQARKLARSHHRSVQEEIRTILVQALSWQSDDWGKDADLIRDRIASRSLKHSNSTALIREDRDR